MVKRGRRLTHAALTLASIGPAIAAASCANVWGFDPLTLAADGGETGDGSVGGEDGGNDATKTSNDGAAPSDASAGAGGGVSCENSNGTCRCTTMPTGSGGSCSPAALGVAPSSVVCCADPAYPQNGSCMCQWIGCTTSNGVCVCGPGNGQPGGSCEAGAWTCCVQASAPECVCAAIACQSGFSPIGNACAISDVACPGAQRAVSSCN